MLRDGVEQLLRNFVGIGVEEANPLPVRGLDLRQAGEQMSEAVVQSEIFAVAGGILADQVDLANTLLEEAGGFRDHRFEAAAAEIPAVLRGGAEGGGVIAAFGHLDR